MSSEHDDSTDEAQRLSVHLVNGPTVACGNFKAIEEGVLLFEDAERERVTGFVPYGELRFVLPTDGDVRPAATTAAESDGSGGEERGEEETEVETEVEVEAGDGVEVEVEAETELEREGGDEIEVESDVEVEAHRKEEEEAEEDETDEVEAGRDDEPATARFDSGGDEATDDVEVQGAEEAAEAEAHEPDAAAETVETGDEDEEETTSEASSHSQATAEETTDSGGSEGLTAVKGIGEAYAEDLRNAGIDSLVALAAADASDVAESTGVSPERAEQWIADAAEASGENAVEEDSDGTGAEA